LTLFDTSNSVRGRRRLMLAVAVGALTGIFLGTEPVYASFGEPATHGSNNPAGLNNMMLQARQAIKQGHPNVAVIYLRNAANLAPKNADVRLELGYAYMQSGDMSSAVRELRAARQNGAPDARVLPLLYEAMIDHGESQALLDQFPQPDDNDRSDLAATTLRARGAAQMKTGRPDLAAPELDKALAIKRDAPTLVARARLAKDQNDLKLAMSLTDEAIAKSPKDVNGLLLKITLLQVTGKAEQALGPADNLVKQYPGNPMALLARAGIYMQMGQDGKARVDVDAALAQVKNLPQALYYKALLLERAKDTRGAWAIAQVLPPEFVNSRPEIGPVVAQMALAGGHNDVAMTLLSASVSKFPDNPEPRIYLAAQYLQMKNAQRALDTLLPMKDSQEARVMALLGQAYALQGQYGKATEYFEKASANGFGGDLLKRQLAVTSLTNGDMDTALKQLRDLNARQPGDSVTAGLLITALLRSNQIPEASKIADTLTAKAPKSPYGPLYQGQIFIANGDFNGAIGAFSRALAIDPKFVPALYDRAVARAARSDVKGANADIQAVLAADPKNTMAMIRGAELSMQMGQDQNALALLRRAVATDPKSSMSNLALTSFFIVRNRMKEAGDAVAAFLKRVPSDPTAQTMQAEIQLATGQVDPALATFRRLAATHPDSSQIQLLLGTALASKKDTNGALAAYKRAVQLSPKFSAGRSALIRYALATNHGDDAIAAAQDGVKQDPGTQSELLLASTYSALKKVDLAQAVLKQSLAQHPSEAAVIMSSQLYRMSKKPKLADALLTGWIAKHPNDIGARLDYAQGLMATNPAAAEQQFRAILKTQPQNIVALNNLSWLLQKKDPKQAVAYAEQAAKNAPNSAAVLDTLGWVRWQAKDGPGALSALQRAHATDGDNPEIAYHLAVVLQGTGHRDEAKKTLSGALAGNKPFDERQEAEALIVRWR
jgi:putative PEP-CTERM system TPR-repeat lipoprotein